MAKEKIRLEVNGKVVILEIEPDELLVDLLRKRLGLTGTKAGCRAGECGACSVILNGRVVTSCLIPAMKADGGKVTTVEGLEKEGRLHPLQEAFVEKGAIQCGFCTPGMLMSAKNLLDQNPHPTAEEIKTAISGVLCRCTGYRKIIHAIQAASEIEGI
ncbi:MAG: (2Fe-2S)-binding protein [Deltaproteobacteria bacterium]|nr:MAG: (2Fe-2S)-binding protein [Deltaproteobacteria bacterium]